MRVRPCIDLHGGKVKQIVGGTLRDTDSDAVVTNFETSRSPTYFAELYKRDGLTGGHVIMLGPGNEQAAESALAAYPEGLQIGGGIRPENARTWLEHGAAKVIVTSYVFTENRLDWDRLRKLTASIGRDQLVLDVSCRRVGNAYVVATDRWQTLTDLTISPQVLTQLAEFCSEFLVHGVDVEGRQQGIEANLVRDLTAWSPLPTTYAGGVRSMDDLLLIERLGHGKLDATVGSALDIFGGNGMRYEELVAFDRQRR